MQWDFGDGQSSDQASPEHVFVRPGLYPVKLSIQRGVKRIEITYILQIDQPKERQKDLHEIDRYLPILEAYDPTRLDAESLYQLVLAYLWKAELTVTPKPDKKKAPEPTDPVQPPDPEEETRLLVERETAAREYSLRAVDAAKIAFLGDSAAEGDEALFKLAQLAGPLARDQLGDSLLAGKIWHGASQRISRPELQAECRLAAADIALNDLLNPSGAKPLLDHATGAIGRAQTGGVVSKASRVWGDYYAATGDGTRAKEKYLDADRLLASDRSHIEQTAWRGAHSRSTEQFLKSARYGHAAQQLRAWQREFPSEKLGGYLHLLFARYWAGRKNYAAAIAQSEQIQVVNPDSPYADQLLALAADCEEKRGRPDRALATFHSLLRDYPGSPLVPHVRDKVKRLETEQSK
jgi:TolA-binding protein